MPSLWDTWNKRQSLPEFIEDLADHLVSKESLKHDAMNEEEESLLGFGKRLQRQEIRNQLMMQLQLAKQSEYVNS